ncbi:hypothetical protein [Coxiella burnetii]|uniref:Uncharacterized protein n=1 Tax=Coxiella burnetii (strain Dugway 5J108-111) TaxID=434922 RepID=B5XHR4_COXBN|nr:hypothetical protein [Coxiella burnetii]ACI23094.1 hypothetical protein CBUD_0378a [Coxiella burnetii Dugway 5J108-111]ACJ17835.1 hypothetical protein CbuG_0404 [Coxiella burnetii CbuG_Q212]ATN66269.1 hypothetical protein AYM17_01895 [Coxiella burnetii]ATN74978.1 hypothetical protein AYM90_08380 [Coxiella burnetii]ATN76882.1 hypothetical protein AYM94_08385 [Coxiella burnetii]
MRKKTTEEIPLDYRVENLEVDLRDAKEHLNKNNCLPRKTSDHLALKYADVVKQLWGGKESTLHADKIEKLSADLLAINEHPSMEQSTRISPVFENCTLAWNTDYLLQVILPILYSEM